MMSPLAQVYVREVIEYAKVIHKRGWVDATAGNFSIRDGEVLWMSPSAVSKGSLRSRDFVAVDIGTGLPRNPYQKASGELGCHLVLYRLNPKVRCVVHCHPHHSVIRSRAQEAFDFQGHEMVKALGQETHRDKVTFAIHQNLTPNEMDQIARVSDIKALQNEFGASSNLDVLILSGHGIYAGGQNPLDAITKVEAIEYMLSTSKL